MDQIPLGRDPLPKKTRKEVFLEKMNKVVPWAGPMALVQPHARGAHQALGGRPPFAVGTMLRIHCMQLWWNLSDPAVEKELHECPLYRRFVGLEGGAATSGGAGMNAPAMRLEAATRPAIAGDKALGALDSPCDLHITTCRPRG